MNSENIRSHIINNFRNDDINVLKEAIEESIKEGDEITLPGMGVFLEIIWKNADENLKKSMLRIIEKNIKRD